MKVFFFATLLAVVGSSYAIQCFECNSARDSACSDPFSAESPALSEAFVVACAPNATYKAFCRKTKMSLNGEVRIQRDCGYMRRENYTCYQQRSEDHFFDVCQCDTDNCNTATSFQAPIVAAFVSTIAAVFFTRA
ncbi:uncharacterized protein LOC108666454 isoform X2 [Hyalella azteca]|uniref:Uncharacterized protein LOC108666454 isoform X2 n=1 Tax=Hyalella azteca TaxID=294128 RepID=A0A8B7N4P8_HYAAZ|nr:uncharacterized protein LOC108666454 isoform X2 [Hyalella azteca]